MALPLRRSARPKHNAPAWAAGVAAALHVVLNAVQGEGLPGWMVGVIAIIIVGAGVASQFHTTPEDP